MEKDQKVLHFKVILLGNTAVGKSSLLNRYTRQVFAEEYDATIGVEFGSRTVTLQGGVPVKLMIWDTAGQESFRSIIRTYYRNVGTVFLVFDLTDKKSLHDLRSWIVEAREHTEEGTAYILVGNKKDMDSKSHQVSKEDAVRFKN
jgi:small GTP-binding protein